VSEPMGTIISILILALVIVIPISAAVRLVASWVSPRVRLSIARHPIAHLVWLLAAIAIVVLVLSLPPSCHRPATVEINNQENP